MTDSLIVRATKRRLEHLAEQIGDPDAFVSAARDFIDDHMGGPGLRWVAAQPSDDPATWPVEAFMCCDSAAIHGPQRCTCWVPIFDAEQAPPTPPADPSEITVMPAKCGDCAYRRGSPERADDYMADTLLELGYGGEPFWCHDGMRRPRVWRHPTLGEQPGDPSDYQPPTIAGIPFRANGRVGSLCAGWAAVSRKTSADA